MKKINMLSLEDNNGTNIVTPENNILSEIETDEIYDEVKSDIVEVNTLLVEANEKEKMATAIQEAIDSNNKVKDTTDISTESLALSAKMIYSNMISMSKLANVEVHTVALEDIQSEPIMVINISNEELGRILTAIIDVIKTIYYKIRIIIKKLITNMIVANNQLFNTLLIINNKVNSLLENGTISTSNVLTSEDKEKIFSYIGAISIFSGSRGLQPNSLISVTDYYTNPEYIYTIGNVYGAYVTAILNMVNAIKSSTDESISKQTIENEIAAILKAVNADKVSTHKTNVFLNKIAGEELKSAGINNAVIGAVTSFYGTTIKYSYLTMPTLNKDKYNVNELNQILTSMKFDTYTVNISSNAKEKVIKTIDLLSLSDIGSIKGNTRSGILGLLFEVVMPSKIKEFVDDINELIEMMDVKTDEFKHAGIVDSLAPLLKPVIETSNYFTTKVMIDTIINYLNTSKSILQATNYMVNKYK